MQIPLDRLDPETLTRLIEEFVSREGTDYGHASPDLLVKVDGIRRKLKSGDAVLCFDEVSETCHILSREAYRSLQKSGFPSAPPQSHGVNMDF